MSDDHEDSDSPTSVERHFESHIGHIPFAEETDWNNCPFTTFERAEEFFTLKEAIAEETLRNRGFQRILANQGISLDSVDISEFMGLYRSLFRTITYADHQQVVDKVIQDAIDLGVETIYLHPGKTKFYSDGEYEWDNSVKLFYDLIIERIEDYGFSIKVLLADDSTQQILTESDFYVRVDDAMYSGDRITQFLAKSTIRPKMYLAASTWKPLRVITEYFEVPYAYVARYIPSEIDIFHGYPQYLALFYALQQQEEPITDTYATQTCFKLPDNWSFAYINRIIRVEKIPKSLRALYPNGYDLFLGDTPDINCPPMNNYPPHKNNLGK